MNGNLFAGKTVKPKEVLVVVRHESRPNTWSVVRYGTSEALRSYGSECAAWYHACWSRFHATNTLPRVTDGGWFYAAGSKGYTSDPRFAETEPASDLADKRREIDRAIVRFIRAKVGSMDALEAFLPGDVTPITLTEADGLTQEFEALAREVEEGSKPETPLEIPRIGSESLSGNDGATTPPDEPEASESDSEAEQWEAAFWEDHARDYADDPDYRRAFNFLDLAENAPSPQARAYWLEKWEELG